MTALYPIIAALSLGALAASGTGESIHGTLNYGGESVPCVIRNGRC
jgi:hypothetical protein